MSRLLAILLFLVAAGLIAGDATAQPSVLVDHVHGYLDLDHLEAVWPGAQFTVLGPQDFPIDNILSQGVAHADEEYTVTVPSGQDCLYGYFLCDPSMIQHPFINVLDPTGAMVRGGFCGGFHVEDPDPGDWVIRFSDWEPELRPYTIGTGPDLFTTALLTPYDVVIRTWENTGQMFFGEVPEYSPREELAVADYLIAGGSHLYLREPLVEMALKPVIDLTAPVDMVCDLSIGLPGRLTYDEPAAEEHDRVATWRGIDIEAGGTTQLLYEVAMTPPHHHLRVTTAQGLALENLTDGVLREVMLVRHLGGDRWQLADGADLAPRTHRILPAPRELTLAELDATLAATMQRGGLAAGLGDCQMTTFQRRYHWVDRLILDSTRRGGWTALYRVDAPLCEALLPLVTDPPAAHRVRTLWFWLADIPDGLTGLETWPAAPVTPVLNRPAAAASELSVAEYGVIRQRYPVATAAKEREQTWLGWTFHDEFSLVDEWDHLGDPYRPLFHLPGGHPDAVELLDGLAAIGEVTAGGILAPEGEKLVMGDGDTYSEDGFFEQGSYPAFVVGRSVGSGRAAAVASRSILDSGVPENAVYLDRLLTWAAGIITDSPDPVPSAALQVAVRPNPFNPVTTITYTMPTPGAVTVAVHDAAGRRIARLFRGQVAAGDHVLQWDGRDDRGQPAAAGVYLLRVCSDQQEVGCKLTLVE